MQQRGRKSIYLILALQITPLRSYTATEQPYDHESVSITQQSESKVYEYNKIKTLHIQNGATIKKNQFTAAKIDSVVIDSVGEDSTPELQEFAFFKAEISKCSIKGAAKIAKNSFSLAIIKELTVDIDNIGSSAFFGATIEHLIIINIGTKVNPNILMGATLNKITFSAKIKNDIKLGSCTISEEGSIAFFEIEPPSAQYNLKMNFNIVQVRGTKTFKMSSDDQWSDWATYFEIKQGVHIAFRPGKGSFLIDLTISSSLSSSSTLVGDEDVGRHQQDQDVGSNDSVHIDNPTLFFTGLLLVAVLLCFVQYKRRKKKKIKTDLKEKYTKSRKKQSVTQPNRKNRRVWHKMQKGDAPNHEKKTTVLNLINQLIFSLPANLSTMPTKMITLAKTSSIQMLKLTQVFYPDGVAGCLPRFKSC